MSLHQAICPPSSYSSLGSHTSAVYVHSAARARLPPNRALLPQPAWKPSYSYHTDAKSVTQTIEFDFVGAPRGYGIPIAEVAARGNLNGVLQGANDVIRFGSEKIMFRILWPGYEYSEWVRTINSTPNLTKGHLAVQLCTHILHYVEKMGRESIRPDKKQWAIGRNHISFENVILVSFFNIGHNTWQAELHIQFNH